MAKTAVLNIRIDPDTKAKAERLFESFGITITDAVNVFLHQSLMENGFPFELKQPSYNTDTNQVIVDARAGKNIQKFDSAKAMFEELKKD